jgi:putative phosphoribosyl transferase
VQLPIKDRATAGRALAAALAEQAQTPRTLVLALPRGGLPVASEIAAALGATLDLITVRKLGAPMQPELAMGAIASGGIRVMNRIVIEGLDIDQATVDEVAQREQRELERREQAYRGERPPPDVTGATVILVDDGVATGATMRAAIAALRRHDPAKVVVAVPVAPAETLETLRREADEVVCLATPAPFVAIGKWYHEFPQLDDDTVRTLLRENWSGMR